MKLKSWQLLLILLTFGGVLFAAGQAGSEWRKYRTPDLLRVSRAGELYVVALNRILVYGSDGVYQRTVDLSQWGIEQSTGGIDVFSNGDLLMLEGSHNQGLLLQVLTWLRMEKLLLTGTNAEKEGRRLVRCPQSGGLCIPLPGLKRRFTNTFRVLIDGEDRIFLADTARDTVSWLASDGSTLDEVNTGFRFPNQITLEADANSPAALLVANTNHNEVTRIPLLENKFAALAEWQHFPLDGIVASRSGHIWPVEVVTTADARYVLQQGNNMGNGLLVKYDKSGNFVMPFTMPALSDAMSVAWFDNTLLVADAEQMKVWRYTVDGQLHGELASYELSAWLQELSGKKQHSQKVEKQWWLLFKLLLVAGFIAAVIGEKMAGKRNQEEALAQAHVALAAIEQQGESEMPSVDDPAIHWIAFNERRLRMMRMVRLAVVLLIAVNTLFLVSSQYSMDDHAIQDEFLRQYLLTQGGFLLVILLVSWLSERIIRRMGIGVLREWVILRDVAGKSAVGRGEDIQLFGSSIAIGNVAVKIGYRKPAELPKRSGFDTKEMQQWLAPVLMQAQEKSGLDMLRWFFTNKPLQMLLTILLIAFVVGLRFWLITHR